MTVQTNTNVASFNGNGVTQIFPIAFKFNNDTDLVVLLIDDATGAVSQLALNSDYTVSGEGDEDGGLINVVAAPAVGQRLKVTRLVDILQLTDLRNQGKFFAEVHEDAFDLLTMIAQQHETSIRSSLRVAESDPEPARLPPAASRANQLLSFDAFGNPSTAAPASGSASDLAIALADAVDPGKGAGLVGFQGGTVADLGNNSDPAKGAALIGYLGGTLAAYLAGLMSAKGPYILASKNGIDVTGATDQAAAINALLGTMSAGQTLIIDGTVRTNSPIIIPDGKEGISIRGINRRGSTIRSYGAGSIIESATKDTVTLKWINISDLLILKDATATGSASLIDLKSMQLCNLSRLWILGAGVAGQIGIKMEAVLGSTECSYNRIEDCVIGGVNDGVSIRNVANSNECYNVRCQIPISGGYAFRFVVNGGTYINNLVLRKCSSEYPGKISSGVFVGDNVDGVEISGCRFESQNIGVYVAPNAGKVILPYGSNYFSSNTTNVNNQGKTLLRGTCAAARFTGGATPELIRGVNVSSVVKSAIGTYDVTFAEAIGTDYIPTVSSSNPMTEWVSPSTNSIQIRTRNSSGALADASFVSLHAER